MKDKIQKIVNETNPKAIGPAIKRDTNVWAVVQRYSNDFPADATVSERVWAYLNDATPYCTSHSKRKRFISSSQGYGYCGMTKVCECAQKNVSEKVSATKSKFTPEQIAASNALRVETSKQRYGVSNNAQTVSAKAAHTEFYADPVNVQAATAAQISTLQERYGVSNSRHIPASEAQRDITIFERYGVANPMSNPAIAQKAGDTRRGIPMSREVFKVSYDRIKARFLEDYSLLFLMPFEEYLGVTNIGFIPLQCSVCSFKFQGRMDYGNTPICRMCHPVEHHYRSIPELEILEFIRNELDIRNIRSGDKQLLNGMELDILSYDHKIAVEYGGLYWHCEKLGKHRNYHADKLRMCNELGYRLITIFADEWMFKRRIVENKLRNAFGKVINTVGARKLKIVEPTPYEHRKFLDENHLQGYVRASFVYSLVDQDNQTLALMSFGNLRSAVNQTHLPDHYEMIRFAVKQGFNVPGGASRLMKAFTKQWHPKSIISYADLRWSEGNLYKTLGFTSNDKPTIGYSYTKDFLRRESRHNFTKAKLVEQGADPQYTEAEIMMSLGFNKIWDCGILKFIWSC